MTNRLGSTARLALSPATLTRFIESKTELRFEGTPRRGRKYINGFPMESSTDSRTFRRWRTSVGTVTKASAARLFINYGLDLEQYAYWCRVRDVPPTVRGELPAR